MKKYGSKDIMRMESIQQKSAGEYMSKILYAYNMACAITEPGKAMARGYAAQAVFGEHSAISQVFFERAYDLGGKDVKPVASVNPLDTSDEGIEAEYENIPENEQPGSRRLNSYFLNNKFTKKKTPWAELISLGKINLIKGNGPQFDVYEYPLGTLEMWKTEEEKYRMVYTGNYESSYKIGEKRAFKIGDKINTWTMVDFIESEHISNLAPLYGKSILIYKYD